MAKKRLMLPVGQVVHGKLLTKIPKSKKCDDAIMNHPFFNKATVVRIKNVLFSIEGSRVNEVCTSINKAKNLSRKLSLEGERIINVNC